MVMLIHNNAKEEAKSVKECSGFIYRDPYQVNLDLNICLWGKAYVSCKEVFNLPKFSDVKHCYKPAQ